MEPSERPTLLNEALYLLVSRMTRRVHKNSAARSAPGKRVACHAAVSSSNMARAQTKKWTEKGDAFVKSAASTDL